MNSKPFLPEEEIHVPVRGGELAVFRYGASGGKPILAFHGISSSNRAWQWFARTLVPNGFTIYAPDLRGRGNSNSLPAPYGMAAHAEDLLAVVDHLGLTKVDVIGHSMGGWVALAFLAIAPDRISRTVLIEGGILLPLPPGFTVEQVLPYVLGPALARLDMTFKSKDEYRQFWKSQAAFVKGWGAALDEYVDYDLKGIAPNLHSSTVKQAVVEDATDEFGNEPIENTLRNMNEEVLMVRAVRGLQNEDTPLYPEATLFKTLKKYPKIKVLTIPDTNHYDILLSEAGAKACANIIYGSD